MTLQELVGTLIIGKVGGLELTGTEEKLLREGTMGGVTLFKENAQSVPQLVQLADSICAARKDAVIAVDQEGGAVQRFDHVLSPLPSQLALAASSDGGAVEKIVAVNCNQLKLVGVNCLLAPVLDVSCNVLNPIIGSRSFGSAPEEVGRLGTRYAQAVRGLIPAGKHFPGHGDVIVDSHLDIPTLQAGKEQLFQRELIPFQMCMPHLPVLMVGHILVPVIDTDMQASLSYKVITELLRNKLGFSGVVMTDDLIMGAITRHYDLGQAAVKAIAAGADQVLVGSDCEQITAVHAALTAAAENGEISVARLEQSADRIRKCYRSSKNYGGNSTLDQAQRIEAIEHRLAQDSRICFEIMQSAASLLRGGMPDVAHGNWMILAPEHPRYKFGLCEQLNKHKLNSATANGNISELRFPLNPQAENIAAVAEKIKEGDTNCIFLCFRSSVYPGQMELAKMLGKKLSAHKLYCVETDLPTKLTPECKNVIATFDPSDAAVTALAELLMSKQRLTPHPNTTHAG